MFQVLFSITIYPYSKKKKIMYRIKTPKTGWEVTVVIKDSQGAVRALAKL